ncbi:hypothetical protein ACJX0J_023816 [Zea mays]
MLAPKNVKYSIAYKSLSLPLSSRETSIRRKQGHGQRGLPLFLFTLSTNHNSILLLDELIEENNYIHLGFGRVSGTRWDEVRAVNFHLDLGDTVDDRQLHTNEFAIINSEGLHNFRSIHLEERGMPLALFI